MNLVTGPDDDGKWESISGEVIAAVSEYKQVEPIDIEPLFDVIDPDALDALFACRSTDDSSVRFEIAGCQVRVSGDSGVYVRSLSDREGSL